MEDVLFPLSIEGTIPNCTDNATDVKNVSERICVEIGKLGLEGSIQGSAVSFSNNKNLLSQMTSFDRSIQIVDSGEFTVESTGIRYRISTTIFVVFYSTVLTLPLVLCLVIRSIIGIAAVLALWFFWVVVSYLSAIIRVHRALRRAIATPSPSLSP